MGWSVRRGRLLPVTITDGPRSEDWPSLMGEPLDSGLERRDTDMDLIVRDTIYINGAWVPSTGTGTLPVTNSTTEEVMGTIPEGTAEDVDEAVAAASAAFPAGPPRRVEERAKYCSRIAEGLAGPHGRDRHPGQPGGRAWSSR